MQIVIDIPEGLMKVIDDIKDESFINQEIHKVISNGTPLPKGHGRLIDADMVCDELEGKSFSTSSDYHNAIGAVDDAPTIIEADKAESEDKE